MSRHGNLAKKSGNVPSADSKADAKRSNDRKHVSASKKGDDDDEDDVADSKHDSK